VIVHAGALLAWVAKNGNAILTFLPQDEPERSLAATHLARCLAAQVEEGSRRALLIETIDRKPASESPLGPALEAAGFVLGARGWMKRARRFKSEDDFEELPS
jgi:ATP-dependent Lhr-like helicase